MSDKEGTGKKERADHRPVTKFGNGSIVSLFDRTPAPVEPDDVFCPHFWEIKYANGCKYDCSWCYLNGTFRYSETPRAPRLKNMDKTVKILEAALTELPATMFNAGEVSDALVYIGPLTRHVLPVFARHIEQGHKILLLTKDDTMELIGLPSHYRKFVVMAYSVNAPGVAEHYELGAPHPFQRLKIAHEHLEAGFEVRLRLDPIVPVENWRLDYSHVIDKIMELAPTVSVITLGSLRGLQSTIMMGNKLHPDRMDWLDYLKDASSWGKRVDTDTRIDCYEYVIERLRRKGYEGRIALCKETLEVFKRMGMEPKKQQCNCMMDAPKEEQ